MLMQWGPYTFEANAAAYEELRHRTGKRWPRHEIIGRSPAGQYLGPQLEEISLRGTVYPMDQKGAGGQALAMGQEAKANTSYTLVSGQGDVYGVFTLETCERVESEIVGDGVPLKVTYDLKFVEDPDAGGAIWKAWP